MRTILVALVTGACLLGPAPFAVSDATAETGTAVGLWRLQPPPSLHFGQGMSGVDPKSGLLHAIGREDDVFVLWTYDRTNPERPWSRRETTSTQWLGNDRFLFDRVGRRFLAVGFRTIYNDTLPPVYVPNIMSLPIDGANPAWERLELAEGSSPGARQGAIHVLDAEGQRLFLVGGERAGTDGYMGDLWELSLDPPRTWQRVEPDGPDLGSASTGYGLFDVEHDRLLIIGRDSIQDGSYTSRCIDAIDLSGARQWYNPVDSDTSRFGDYGPTCFVPELGLLFVLHTSSLFTPADSTYLRVLDVRNGGWSSRPIGGASSPMVDASILLTFDPATSRVVFLGGRGTRPSPEPYASQYYWTTQHADVWSFSAVDPLPAWSRHYSSVNQERVEPSLTFFDPDNRIVYSPHRFGSEILFSYRLDDPAGWEAMEANGRFPRRSGAVGVYDPKWNRLVMFGGGENGAEFGDLWECALGTPTVTWRRRVGDGDTPMPRIAASAVRDPLRNRMILFGGFGGRPLDDAWQLDLNDSIPRWSPIDLRGAPPPGRWGHTAIYDSRRDAMIVFGGAGGSPEQPAPLNDVWSMSFIDGDTWLPVLTQGNPPLRRYAHTAGYDPVGDRMVILWGMDRYGARFDNAALEFGSPSRWTSYTPEGLAPMLRIGATFAYDEIKDRAFIVGGEKLSRYGGFVGAQDAWSIEWNRTDRTPPPPIQGGPAFVLRAVGPNPSAGEVNIAFELPRPTAVSARLYDARGRMVRDLGSTTYPPGPHVLIWDGKDQSGSRLRDGVYFARVLVEGQAYAGKIVLMD